MLPADFIHHKKTSPSTSVGFSLIELLVVVSIISVLSTVGLAAFLDAQASARDAQRMADMKAINDALQQYYADNGRYPGPLDGVPGTGQMIGVGNDIDILLEPYLETVPQDPLHDAGSDENPASGALYWYSYDPWHIIHLGSCNTDMPDPDGGWDDAAVVYGFNRAESWGNTNLSDLSTRDVVTCQGTNQNLDDASFNRLLRPLPPEPYSDALWTP
ncbi:MAG: type II secretion system protein [Patescibacteria group bacterium]